MYLFRTIMPAMTQTKGIRSTSNGVKGSAIKLTTTTSNAFAYILQYCFGGTMVYEATLFTVRTDLRLLRYFVGCRDRTDTVLFGGMSKLNSSSYPSS